MLKNQKGVALIVALIVTIIIGVIAISIGGVAYKGQRSQNLEYSNVVSTSNAFAGATRAINVLSTIIPLANTDMIRATESTDESDKTNWILTHYSKQTQDLVTSLQNVFVGIDSPMDSDIQDTNASIEALRWYTDVDEWKDAANKCVKCITSDNNDNPRYQYRIERRGLGGDPASDAPLVYRYYRVTSRGTDGVDPNSATVVQTIVGVLGTIDDENAENEDFMD
ncbi:MAG: hypothetical protein ACI4V7_05895 [Succinivibrionaceae bacterium]